MTHPIRTIQTTLVAGAPERSETHRRAPTPRRAAVLKFSSVFCPVTATSLKPPFPMGTRRLHSSENRNGIHLVV